MKLVHSSSDSNTYNSLHKAQTPVEHLIAGWTVSQKLQQAQLWSPPATSGAQQAAAAPFSAVVALVAFLPVRSANKKLAGYLQLDLHVSHDSVCSHHRCQHYQHLHAGHQLFALPCSKGEQRQSLNTGFQLGPCLFDGLLQFLEMLNVRALCAIFCRVRLQLTASTGWAQLSYIPLAGCKTTPGSQHEVHAVLQADVTCDFCR